MKRHGNLWERIISYDNLYLALKNASRGKKRKAGVKKVLRNPDKAVHKLHDILVSGFKNSKYRHKIVYEPKQRLIYILPFFPDRIVHHAVINIVEDIWDNLFISDSYSCRKDKGQHAGSKRCMDFVRRYKYCLKCDISKFYPSINHDILKQILRKKIKDEKLLSLLDTIIDSIEGDKNVPIGNYLSQWFGNLYLNELDMFVKHFLHCKAYIRYCDDFVFFSNSKEELRNYLNKIIPVLNNLKLVLSKKEIFPVSQGIDFLGYRHFTNYILVRKSTAKRIRKRMSHIEERILNGKLSKERARSQIASAEGWLKHANSYNFKNTLQLDKLKRITLKRFSDFCKERNLEGKKIPISKVCSKEVEILAYRITKTKYSDNCAQIQFKYKDALYITFTSSKVLIRQLIQYKEELPFVAFIKNGKSKDGNSYYTFS